MVGPNKQTGIDTHTHAQLQSHQCGASVGLAQAHPNKTIKLEGQSCQSSVQFSLLQLVSCHVIENQEIGFTKVDMKVVGLSSDYSWQYYYMLRTIILICQCHFKVSLWLWLHLKHLTVTEISIKSTETRKYEHLKMQGWHANKYKI